MAMNEIDQLTGRRQGAGGARRHTGFQQKRSLKSHQSVIVWSEKIKNQMVPVEFRSRICLRDDSFE